MLKGKKKIIIIILLLILGAVEIILAACVFENRVENVSKNSGEVHREAKKKETENKETEEKLWRVHRFQELENIYYLTEDEASFKEKASAFILSKNLNASTVTALSKFKDTKEDPVGKAYFYLQLDDREKTVIEAEHDKKTGEYSFRILEEEIPNIEDYGGERVKQAEDISNAPAEPEYTDEWEEQIDLGNPVIKDQNNIFAKVEEQQEQFCRKLLEFLQQEKEGRRNLTAVNAARTEEGYEAEFSFDNARTDEKNLKVMYNKEENLYMFILSSEAGERGERSDE